MADFTTEPGEGLTWPGRPRIFDHSAHRRVSLDSGWQFCSVAHGAATPGDLTAADPAWADAEVPGTIASAQRAAGVFDLDRVENFDAAEWWYRCTFPSASDAGGGAHILCFDGLATLADVWLNGVHVLTSDNMFLAHELDITTLVAASNVLLIRFTPLQTSLARRQPRPRWRTKLVEHQQLRWHRTTLLGRMPGWSPPVRAVGPWRPVRVEVRRSVDIIEGDVLPAALERGGRVHARLRARVIDSSTLTGAVLHVGAASAPLQLNNAADGVITVTGSLTMPEAAHWWPHTHGAQPGYDAHVVLSTGDGDIRVSFGRISFRKIVVDQSDDGFAVHVNGARVFCRGACWTTPDIVSLAAADGTLRDLLTLARDAGMNMLRIGGTMVYEEDTFYDLCDELGILVWQDFMFANMDYPADDAFFAAQVAREATEVIARLRRHPCIAILCGNSEVQQQAAMLGLERASWSNAIFDDILPRCCAVGIPGVLYWPSSPAGGALPFHADVGAVHYYGVGAYLRPLEDARRSRVRFASECLGFSNIPARSMIDRLLPNGESPCHHPAWKARVPRDHGSGWDFEDVRDHYLETLFGESPARLRYSDMERYLALSRVVTGEVMAQTIGEWRRVGSSCNGALVWFFQDLWPGAGWGIIDALGQPKAAYYALKRALQPVALALTDEGASGLHIHVLNDRPSPFEGTLTLSLLRGTRTVVATDSADVAVRARSGDVVRADDLLGRFLDTACAFRFGPPGHDAAVATLRDRDGNVVSEVFHSSGVHRIGRTDDPLLTGRAFSLPDGCVEVQLHAAGLVRYLELEVDGFVLDDNYFHMAPGAARTLIVRPVIPGAAFVCHALPLNAFDALRIVPGSAMSTGTP